MKFIKLAIINLCFGLFTVGVHAQDFAPTVNEGYVLQSALWHSNLIPVCWEDPRIVNSQEGTWVRNAIARTWEARSLVRFVGWRSCPSVGQFDGIRIAVRDEVDPPHTEFLGTKIAGRPEGMVLNFTFHKWSPVCARRSLRRFCIEAVAAHEFGHALGFAHEQNRPDTQDEACRKKHNGNSGNILFGPWDSQSIMNYCNPVWHNGGLLSRIDGYMVKTYYGNVADYFHRSKMVCMPVIAAGNAKYSGCLARRSDGRWRVTQLQKSGMVSVQPATFTGNKLTIPFIAGYDLTKIGGENYVQATGFYQAELRRDRDGLFTLLSVKPLPL